MPSINYIQILKDAWQITWKNKFLWWFGLLIALGSPGFNFNFNPGGNENINDATIKKVLDFITQNMHWIIIGSIIFLAILIILMVIGIIARAGLTKSIDSVSKNKPVGFKQGMKEGKKYFWKLLGLGITIFFLILASVLVLGFPVIFLFVNKSYFVGIFLGLLAFLIFIPVLILVSFLRIYGNLYIVLGELRLSSALEKAYELFQKNFLASIIMELFFIPLGFVLFFAIIFILIPIVIVFLAIGFILYLVSGTPGVIITAGIGIICFLVLLFLLRSAYETFAQSVWYLFFQEIAKSKVEETVLEEVLKKEEEALPAVNPVKTLKTNK